MNLPGSGGLGIMGFERVMKERSQVLVLEKPALKAQPQLQGKPQDQDEARRGYRWRYHGITTTGATALWSGACLSPLLCGPWMAEAGVEPLKPQKIRTPNI